MNRRQTVEANIPLVRSDKNIVTLLNLSKYNPVISLFEMYMLFTDIHVFCAIEYLEIFYNEDKIQGYI